MNKLVRFALAATFAFGIGSAQANVITVTATGTIGSGIDWVGLYSLPPFGVDLTGSPFETTITFDTAALTFNDYAALSLSTLSGVGASPNFSIFGSVGPFAKISSTAIGDTVATSQSLTVGNGATSQNGILPFDTIVATTSGSTLVTPFGPGLPDHIEYQVMLSMSTFSPQLASHDFSQPLTLTKGIGDTSLGYLRLIYAGQTIETLTYNPQTITMSSAMPVPEPASYAMWLAGLGLMGLVMRRRRK